MIMDNKGKMFEDRRKQNLTMKNGKRKDDNKKVEKDKMNK